MSLSLQKSASEKWGGDQLHSLWRMSKSPRYLTDVHTQYVRSSRTNNFSERVKSSQKSYTTHYRNPVHNHKQQGLTTDNHTEAYRMCSGSQQGRTGVGGDDGGGSI